MIRRALISVSDKIGIAGFAKQLHDLGVEILSTGDTAKLLAEEGIPVIDVSDHTGFPEMMDGRVKTLHPKIHGGILGRRGVDDAVMKENDILPIDLVVVNLSPFSNRTQKKARIFLSAGFWKSCRTASGFCVLQTAPTWPARMISTFHPARFAVSACVPVTRLMARSGHQKTASAILRCSRSRKSITKNRKTPSTRSPLKT